MIGGDYPRCREGAPNDVKEIVEGLFYNERRALLNISNYWFPHDKKAFLTINKFDGERLWCDLTKRGLIAEGKITGHVKLTTAGRHIAHWLTIP